MMPRPPAVFVRRSPTPLTWLLRASLCGLLGTVVTSPALAQVRTEGQPAGSLSGKRVVIDPGHGLAWVDGYGWQFARDEINGIREDIHVNEIVLDFLRQSLEGAGARVLATRAPSRQVENVIVDNADPGYHETGTWTTTTNVNLGWKGSYRYAATDKTQVTATARWSTTLKVRGDYPVWVFYYAGADRSTQAHFSIRHAGGTTRVTVNQQLDRQRWVYLGNFPFSPSQPAEVTLDNFDPGAAAGAQPVVIADAVRFGVGMADYLHDGKPSGYARYTEDARYFMIDHGAPKEVYDTKPKERDSGLYSRPLYADWQGADAFVSIHTNASDMPNQGTGFETFVHSTMPTAGSGELQNAVHAELARTNKQLYAGAVKDRTKKSANFAVLREIKTMPAILCELAFFDTAKPDAALLRDDRYRRDLARALYKGLARYFDAKAVIAPLPPTLTAVRNLGGGRVSLRFRPESDPLEPDAKATSYRVFVQHGDGGFGEPIPVTGTELTVSGLAPGETVYFRVRAVNAGGESLPSAVLGARVVPLDADAPAPVLIVDGFQRIDEAITIRDGDNRGDWIIAHGEALRASRLPVAYFDSIHRAGLADAESGLARYSLVDVLLGAQSGVLGNARTLGTDEQEQLRRYLDGGGRLLVSGSDFGGDLGLRGAPADRTFLRERLALDCTREHSGAARLTPLGRYATLGELRFSAATRQPDASAYPVTAPDVLTPIGAAEAMLQYGDDATVAGVRLPFDSVRPETGARLVVLGVPLETIEPARREPLMTALLGDLLCPAGDDQCLKIPAPPRPPIPTAPLAAADAGAIETGCALSPHSSRPGPSLLGLVPLAALWLLRRRRAEKAQG